MQEKQFQGIKGWKEDDRPREKCLLHGVSALSDAELLAILLGSGTRNKSAVELGREVLKKAGDRFSELSKMEFKELKGINGIGQAKAVTLLAALEIGRRRQAEGAVRNIQIQSSRQAADIFSAMLSDAKYEEFWVMMLNHSNRLIGKVRVSSGGVHETLVDPKHIFKEALQHLATGIVFCHNHPSGGVEPSEADIKLTKVLVSGATALGIRVLDHIIVGTDGYYSFADSHLL